MMHNPQAYYLVKSGPVLKACNQFRKEYQSWFKRLTEYCNLIGAEGYRCNHAGKLVALKFPRGKTPEGFTKPDKHGCSRPKVGSAAYELFNGRAPQPQPDDFLEKVIQCPWQIRYGNEKNYGMTRIDSFFSLYQICWFDKKHTLVIMPDVEKAVARFKADHPGQKILDTEGCQHPEKFKPPAGLKRILSEEWDLMAAKAKAKQDKK